MAKTKTSRTGSNPIRQRPARCRTIEAGFTLVETVVVVAVLAVLVGAVAHFASTRDTSANLNATTQLIAAKLRDARNAAIRRRRQHDVFFDVATRRVWADRGDPALQIDGRIRLSVTAARPVRATKTIASVRFYPNGSASGATVQLLTKSQANEVRINWLTGRVSTKRIR